MARKPVEPTKQYNFRLPIPLMERLAAVAESLPFRPTLTKVVEQAVREYVSRNAPPPAAAPDAPPPQQPKAPARRGR
jgi:hypothetical protein